MPSSIISETLQYLLQRGSTLALLDVREHGEYNAAHIPGASSLPRRLVEFRLPRLVPCPAVQVVVCDDDGPRARLAAATLCEMGYRDVAVLAGGMATWREAGFPIEQGLTGVMTPPEDVIPAGPERPYHDMLNHLRWEEALGHKHQVPSPESKVPSH